MNQWETQLRKGVVELAVLASIGDGEAYGYGIVERLHGLSGLAPDGEHGVPGTGPAGARWFLGSAHRGVAGRADAAVLSAHRARPAAVPADGG